MIMHLAASSNDTANKISPEAIKKIVGGAMFGDPFLSGPGFFKDLLPSVGAPSKIPEFPSTLSERVKNNCAVSFDMVDPVCQIQ
jgi:hypothetical protein